MSELEDDVDMASGDDCMAYGGYYDYADYPETQLAGSITLYLSPVLLVLATAGNVLSMLVLYSLSRHVFSTCVYLCVLAPVDLLVLYTRCGNEWLAHVGHVDLSHMLMVSSDSVCKVYPFAINFLVHVSKWLLVCAAIEGFIATYFPEQAMYICTRARARAIMLLLTVLLVCVNIHYFWSLELAYIKDLAMVKDDVNAYFCTFTKHGHIHSEMFQEVIWPLLDTLLAEVLPFLLVIPCCVLMLCQIVRGRHRGDASHRQWSQRYELHAGAVNQLKVCVCAISMSFIILTLPKFTTMVFFYLVEKYSLIGCSLKLEAQKLLANSISNSLEHVFLSCKPIVYFSASRIFRRECAKKLRKCCCCETTKGSADSPTHSAHYTHTLADENAL